MKIEDLLIRRLTAGAEQTMAPPQAMGTQRTPKFTRLGRTQALSPNPSGMFEPPPLLPPAPRTQQQLPAPLLGPGGQPVESAIPEAIPPEQMMAEQQMMMQQQMAQQAPQQMAQPVAQTPDAFDLYAQRSGGF